MEYNTEEMAQNKLILLYIIKKSPHAFSRHELNEFILDKEYMNYFFLQQYLGELVESNLIELKTIDGKSKYTISKQGNLTLNYFDEKVPKKMKEELAKEFKAHKILQEREKQVSAEYFPKENGQYIVNLKLVENDNVLFSLYLDVSSVDQAKIVCKLWKEDPNSIYANIMNMFIE